MDKSHQIMLLQNFITYKKADVICEPSNVALINVVLIASIARKTTGRETLVHGDPLGSNVRNNDYL